MYGKNVTVEFEGQLRTVYVLCTPTTPKRELERKAIWKLKKEQEEKAL